jgi:uncharacterized protein (TIGR02270 family)
MWDIYEEHLEEAAFLWSQWERALDSPRYTLPELASGVEERLLAHLDGLVLGGQPVAEKMLIPPLIDESAEPDVVKAAAFALLDQGLERPVLLAMTKPDLPPEHREAITRALELSAAPGLEDRLRPWLTGKQPHLARAALAVLKARVIDPGDALDAALGSADPDLLAAALGMVGPTSAAYRRSAIEAALRSDVPAVKEAALRAGLVARMRLAWEACAADVAARRPDSSAAPLAVAVGGEFESLLPWLEDPALRAPALFALGFSGRAAAAEACLPWLGDKEAGAIAFEAFSAITGLPPDGLTLEEPEPEEPPPLEEENLDEPPSSGPEEELPKVDPARVAEWWTKQRDRFRRDVRHLAGAPVTSGALAAALREGPARRRHALALELAIRTQAPLQDTRRWARDQVKVSGGASSRYDDRPFDDLCRA